MPMKGMETPIRLIRGAVHFGMFVVARCVENVTFSDFNYIYTA